MRFIFAAFWYIFLWVTTTFAVPTSDQLLQHTLPIPPTDDPFYVPPTGLENSQPGTILRSRSIDDLSIGGVMPFQVKAAYQLLYRTTDSLRDASAAVTTIIVPKTRTHRGWIVNLPDYEGLQSAFTSGIQAGQATLDSVRAALSSGDLTSISSQAENFNLPTQPELNFKGTALGGLVPNITSVMLSSNKGLFTGLIPAGVIGLTNGYPELKEYLLKNLVPSTASKFYKASLNDVLAITGQMGIYGTPKMPIFLYKAIGDEVSKVEDTDAVVSKLCSQGANIKYARDMFGGHATEAITGAGDAFTFLIDRFNGVPIASGCTINNVWTITFNPRAITALGPTIAAALLALLQVPVGPSDMF
ncbi:uncharacterized protein EAF02_008922 [Botrytis sinoallii]|uniref:uncharacterized protein n=1 Tax=Botrytis sinoallii TaxID=1463999 RepID=UPI0018FF139E|nr:uncharacterized protein EAF02_008922 [Botrytis sinoallii]KAF7872851.1 hypothetical protein EAF02_008922 [Botrytis sinoallii]